MMEVLADPQASKEVLHDEVIQREEQDPTKGDNKFQRAISLWRGVDFSSLISQLDSTAAEVIAHQKDALVERKDVAQKTKDFRKLDDAGKLSEYKTLLKSYQSFVDLLTTHNKTASSAFLQLYTPLSEAPDPFPLLEASVESLVVSEETLPRLASENEELHKRITKLTTQLESTEQKLQTETKARQDAEEGSGAHVQEIEKSWSRVVEEKESNWLAKERVLEEKVENQERLLKELKASYEVSQRLDRDGEESNAAVSKASSAELDLMASDLEKTTARVAEVEARNEVLSIELARAKSQMSKSNGEDPTILRLQTENSALLRRLETARFEKEANIGEWDSKLRQAERQRTSAISESQELKSRLQKCSDYDELKRELNVLRSIELSIDDAAEHDHENSNGNAPESSKDSLEQLLLTRNKKLSGELTLLRVSYQELQEQLDIMREQYSNSNAELEKSQKLASTLENDLLRIQEEAVDALPSSGMSIAGTYTSRYPTSTRRGRGSPTSSIISGFDGQSRIGSTSLESLRSGEPVGGGSGILPMIQAQRDRFKQKNQKLEDELQKTYATVTSLRQEVASLQKDNLSLYEKSRYVSAYSRGANASSSTAYSQPTTHTSISLAQDDDANNRWKSQYEANISPFAAFRGREATRAYKRLTLPERVIFSLTRIVMATRTSRNLFGLYLCGLHTLVLCMLWLSASSGSNSHINQMASAIAADKLMKDKMVRD